MKRFSRMGGLVGLVLVFLLAGFAAPAKSVEASPDELHVGTGQAYVTIGAAITAANAGDTIIVHDGTYTENVDVNKSLTIQSVNGAASTIVEAANSGDHVFEIYADHVNISGLTVKNATGSRKAGIMVWGTDAFAHISNVCCSNNWAGIYLSGDSNTLIGNTVSGNVCGMALYGSSYNVLSSNTVDSNSNYGILVAEGSDHNTLTDNIVKNNAMGGIWLQQSSNNNTIAGNTTENQWGGIGLDEGCSANIVQSNNIAGNTNVGVFLRYSDGNIVSANMVSNNLYGVDIQYANDNAVTGNTIADNVWGGITLRWSSHNTISDNDVRNNGLEGPSSPTPGYGGITVDYPSCPYPSQGNVVYHNNFINNQPLQAWDDGIANIWDDGYPSGGNYWSDYEGVDEMRGSSQDQLGGDGIGDTPYDGILGSANNTDRYPFMRESGWANQPPVAAAGGPYLVGIGSTVTLDGGASSDPDGDSLQYRWDFDGDGDWDTGWLSEPTVDTTVDAYATAGIYNAVLSVTDNKGPESTDTAMVVVYDPSAGFVTGGGWIYSEAGCYQSDPTVAGKATFGFVSKYKKGATVPTGQTEFQFKVANLNFHSDDYDWLVVNQGGTNAQFKGSGTINGSGDYKFMLWAGDDDPDTFCIKIWEEDESGNEAVIYDNGFNQEIGGGSIVIHAKK